MNATQKQAMNRRAALKRLRRAEMYQAELNAEMRRMERLNWFLYLSSP